MSMGLCEPGDLLISLSFSVFRHHMIIFISAYIHSPLLSFDKLSLPFRMIETDDDTSCGLFYHPQFDQRTDPPLFGELKKPKSPDDRDFVEHGDICACISPKLTRCKITRVYADGSRVQLRQCDEGGKINFRSSQTQTVHKKNLKIVAKMSYVGTEMDEEKLTFITDKGSSGSGSGSGSGYKKRESASQVASLSSKKQKQANRNRNDSNIENLTVARFGKSGNILAIYESIDDAVAQTKADKTQITNYLAGKRGINHCGAWGWKRPTQTEIDKFRSSALVVEEFEMANGLVRRRFPSIIDAAEELGIAVNVMKDRCKDRFYQSPYGLGYSIVRMNTDLIRRDPVMFRPHCTESEIKESGQENESLRARRVNRRRMIGGNEVDHVNFWVGDVVHTRYGDGEVIDRTEVHQGTQMYKIKHTVSNKYLILTFFFL